MPAPPKGPFCQSCAMPLAHPEDFGTEADGSRNKEYCAYCYANGAFVNPNMTIDQMRELCVTKLAERAMPRPVAASMMAGVLPTLKRWAPRAPTS